MARKTKSRIMGMAVAELPLVKGSKSSRRISQKDSPLWVPRIENKPQQEAFASPADRLFYGGAAGGG